MLRGESPTCWNNKNPPAFAAMAVSVVFVSEGLLTNSNTYQVSEGQDLGGVQLHALLGTPWSCSKHPRTSVYSSSSRRRLVCTYAHPCQEKEGGDEEHGGSHEEGGSQGLMNPPPIKDPSYKIPQGENLLTLRQCST